VHFIGFVYQFSVRIDPILIIKFVIEHHSESKAVADIFKRGYFYPEASESCRELILNYSLF
jgi:hypothetical protein